MISKKSVIVLINHGHTFILSASTGSMTEVVLVFKSLMLATGV
jgi:hypothetical protein